MESGHRQKPDKKEQERYLAQPSPPMAAAGDEENDNSSALWGLQSSYRQHRFFFCCCGICSAFVLVIGVLILVLSFTVLRVRDPTLTISSFAIKRSSVSTSQNRPVAINMTMAAEITLKNPNVASFTFGNSTTDFYYYGGEMIGVAYAPAGKVGADSTVEMNVTMDVFLDRVASHLSVVDAVLGEDVLNLTSHTAVSGRVNVLGVYKRNLDVAVNCSILLGVAVAKVETKSYSCQAAVS